MRVWHYMYFDARGDADSFAEALRGAGYQTEVLEVTPSWLLRASHVIPESQDILEATAESLTEWVTAGRGEYDGWERETRAGSSWPGD